jgi:hypothetical protein
MYVFDLFTVYLELHIFFGLLPPFLYKFPGAWVILGWRLLRHPSSHWSQNQTTDKTGKPSKSLGQPWFPSPVSRLSGGFLGLAQRSPSPIVPRMYVRSFTFLPRSVSLYETILVRLGLIRVSTYVVVVVRVQNSKAPILIYRRSDICIFFFVDSSSVVRPPGLPYDDKNHHHQTSCALHSGIRDSEVPSSRLPKARLERGNAALNVRILSGREARHVKFSVHLNLNVVVLRKQDSWKGNLPVSES